ncbi:MAG TPA: hypothetical protein VFD13_01520, partial [Candidatus Kapabacteria bacterium]|nr:hypothetical protein [Candidatus Kapabacteria bacterium]
LFCCRYDPATSKYGFVIARALKIGGTLMIIIMGLLFYWMYRRTRKTKTMNYELGIMNGEAHT